MGTTHTHRGGRRYNGRRGRNNQGGPRGPSGSGNAPGSAPQAPRSGMSGTESAAKSAAEVMPGTGSPTPSRSQPATSASMVGTPRDAGRDGVGGEAQAGGADVQAPAWGDDQSGATERDMPAETRPRQMVSPAASALDSQRRPALPARGTPQSGDASAPSNGKRPAIFNGRGAPAGGIGAGMPRDDERRGRLERTREESHDTSSGPGANGAGGSGHRPEPRAAAGGFGDTGPLRTERQGRVEHQEHEPLRPEARGEVGPLIDALHALFERDRSVASQGGGVRCGICYLHYPQADLVYREAEGFYVCAECARALGRTQVFMVRRQQR